ncbi:MAG: extracellular solute-binding protein family 1 [Lachnospiraceae bacterium]|nr:extracellular solute-binding protein family 1 [Lachnospiraceae bacterium]
MKKMKKLVSLMLCLLLVVSMFAACKKDEKDTQTDTPAVEDEADTTDPAATTEPADTEAEPTEEAVSEEPFDLTLGIWPADTLPDEITLHEGYVETFKQTHPNVNVVPAYYFYGVDTFVPLAESGGLPVIFHSYYTDTQKIIAGGYVADITDILAERGWLDAVNPTIKDLMSKDGRTYGIPRDGYALGLMINVDLFKQAGIVDAEGLPIYPKTWQELAETGKKIKDATGAAGLCLLAMDNAGGWHFSNIAWAFGATLTTENADGTFTCDLDSPEAIEAMEYVKSLKWEYDILTADPTIENWGTGFTQIGTGAAAMYIGANDAVNQPTYTNGLPVEDFGLAPLPAGPRGDQYSLSGGTPYMFSKDATKEQINAALDYITIMGKGPVIDEAGMRADAQYRVDSGIPVIYRFPCWVDQKIIDAETAITDEYSNVDMRLYQDYFDTVKKPGNLRMEEPGNTQEMYRELTAVLQAVITDENADVAALMKTADENYQQILDTTVNVD